MKLLWLCNMVPGKVKEAVSGGSTGGATTEPAEVEPAKTNFPWWILVICVVGGCGLGMVIAIVIIPKFKKKD